MAKFPLDLSKFKKTKTDGATTTLSHPDGHSIVVAHKALSPKMRAQVARMPMADGGEVEKSAPELPKAAAEEFVKGFTGRPAPQQAPKSQVKEYSVTPKPASEDHQAAQGERQVAEPERIPERMPENMPQGKEGGESYPATEYRGGAIKDPTQRHLLPGDKVPNAIEKGVVNKARSKMASGGQVDDDDSSKKTIGQIINFPGGDPSPQPKYAGGRMGYADGGDVNASQPAPDQNASQMPQQPSEVEQIQQQAAQQPQQSNQDAARSDMQQRYNSLVMKQSQDSKGGVPDPEGAQAQLFGPNGEAPASFNANVWNQAQGAYEKQGQDAQTAQQQADAKAIQENAARASAGVPLLPTTNPISPKAPTGAQNPQSPSQNPQQEQGDMFGVNTRGALLSLGNAQELQGIQGLAQGEMAQNTATAKILNQQAQQQQQLATDFQKNQHDIQQHNTDFMNALQAQRINPSQFMSSRTPLQRMSIALGLILGGIGGQGHGNMALDYLNARIADDIKGQEAEMDKKKNLLSANREYFQNTMQANQMSQAQLQHYWATRLQQTAATSNNPIVQARAQMASGQLLKQSADTMGRVAMQKTLLGGINSNNFTPQQESNMVHMFAESPAQGEAAAKQLKEAQDAMSLKQTTLDAFDQIAKEQSWGNRVMHPFESSQSISSVRNLILDKLTKDTSGRVTPETVHLVGSIMPGLFTPGMTAQKARAALDGVLSQGMNYPELDRIGIHKYSQGAGSKQPLNLMAPVAPRK